jgi:hypothetical protein
MHWNSVDCGVCEEKFSFSCEDDTVLPLVSRVFNAVCPHCWSKELHITFRKLGPDEGDEKLKLCKNFQVYKYDYCQQNRNYFGDVNVRWIE